MLLALIIVCIATTTSGATLWPCAFVLSNQQDSIAEPLEKVSIRGRVILVTPRSRLTSETSGNTDDTSREVTGDTSGITKSIDLPNPACIPPAFVYLSKGVKGDYEAPKNPAMIRVGTNGIQPRVIGLTIGQNLVIVCDDKRPHQLHACSRKNPVFTREFPAGHRRELLNGRVHFRIEESFAIRCDHHGDEVVYCFVVAHPFYSISIHETKRKETTQYSTDDHLDDESVVSNYCIEQVPIGTYDITAWHPVYGSHTSSVKVTGAKDEIVDFFLTSGTDSSVSDENETNK